METLTLEATLMAGSRRDLEIAEKMCKCIGANAKK